jgi:hypothetical protein
LSGNPVLDDRLERFPVGNPPVAAIEMLACEHLLVARARDGGQGERTEERASQDLSHSNVRRLASHLSCEATRPENRNHAVPDHSGTGVAPCVPQLSNFSSYEVGYNEMVKWDWTKMRASNRRGVFVLLVCAVLGVVPRAEASPFLLNLVASDSSDGAHARGGGERAARLGLRVSRPEMPGPVAIYNGAGLTRLSRPTVSTLSPSTSSHLAVGLIEAQKSSYRDTLASVADLGSVASGGLASVTQLDLGNGAHLAVSDTVGAALADALSSPPSSPPGDSVASSPATPNVANDVKSPNVGEVSGNNLDGQGGPGSGYNSVSPLPSGTANGVADEIVNAEIVQVIVADISSGIVSTVSEPTQRAAAGDFAVAENLVQNPEPATLVLLASALALTASRLRRQRQ